MADTINVLLHVPSLVLLTLFIATHAPLIVCITEQIITAHTLFAVILGLTQGRDNQLDSLDHSKYTIKHYSVTLALYKRTSIPYKDNCYHAA